MFEKADKSRKVKTPVRAGARRNPPAAQSEHFCPWGTVIRKGGCSKRAAVKCAHSDRPDALTMHACRHQCKGRPMRIGAVILAHNEGEEVTKTVESLVGSIAYSAEAALAAKAGKGKLTELRVWVVDDGSKDGSCKALDGPVSVIRHDAAKGVGRSRNAGCAIVLAASMDVVSFHDGHMRFPPGVLEALARKAVSSGAIVTSKSKGWWNSKGEEHKFRAWGCDLHWNFAYGIQPKHRIYCKDQPEWTRVPAPMGACYVMSRATIERLSAPTGRLWDDVAGRWGFSEEALAVKAFLLDVLVLVSRDLATHHHYANVNPLSGEGVDVNAEVWKNRCFAMAALLSEETFERRFRTFCETRLGPKLTAELINEARQDAQKYLHPWSINDERRMFTHLFGRGAPITGPHGDHGWLENLIEQAQLAAAPLTRPMRILQWRPGESTVLLRRHFEAAEITALEWFPHRVQTWRPLMKDLGVNLIQTDLNGWINPVRAGFFKVPSAVEGQGFDLITIGGELQEECRKVAERLLAPGGRIVVNPTGDVLQIEDAERRKAGQKIEEWRARPGTDSSQAVPGLRNPPSPKAREGEVGKADNSSVTVLLLNWRRPENFIHVLRSLALQTVKPCIWIWDNGYGDEGGLKFPAGGSLHPIEEHPAVERAIYSSRNFGCFPRWWLASACETDYVCSMDDDFMFTDERVLEDAIQAHRELCEDGIVGMFGVRLVEGKDYLHGHHFNGRVRRDERVDVIKGRFMLLPRRLLERVPMAIPGVERAEDDLYVSLSVSQGQRGHHVLPARLAGRWKRVGKEDARSNSLRPGHYKHRDEMVRALLHHFHEKEVQDVEVAQR